MTEERGWPCPATAGWREREHAIQPYGRLPRAFKGDLALGYLGHVVPYLIRRLAPGAAAAAATPPMRAACVRTSSHYNLAVCRPSITGSRQIAARQAMGQRLACAKRLSAPCPQNTRCGRGPTGSALITADFMGV